MSNLRDVPKPVQAAGLVAGGAGITAALILIDPKYAIALVIGLGVAAAALLLYHRILKWQSRRKSAPMEEGVLRSGAPQLRKAEEKVKIDNLRRRFEEGIGKFREAGKNLYSLPWFMIVGEPGSGKTEAVRHCNVGFPPGLQDEYQGVGGTINMNWWFTNHGVIVDTAGRLMFEDVEAGGTKEWREFLNLLKRYRPYCPINGVFLVIPADSLVKDTAEQIQQKASKIAQQFNVIQRTLAVRFPVFVVVTKCDLVMGFREFFDGLGHPELQHQIFGWSNPAAIDQPYSREFVRQHLQSVQDRLRRRRLSLLLELADDAAAQESASVNALYSFPGSLAQLAQRMARYLDLIFGAGGEWGAKPVFFRGIYFTSSMQEGDALDEDLAQAVGTSVESLPGGPPWTRNRAYFLRDLFIKKVFPEKGLVTTAVNATKHYVRRRMTFWLSVAAAVLFLLIYTIHAALRFDDTVEHVTKYVAEAANAKADLSLNMVKLQADDPVLWDDKTGEFINDEPVKRYQFYGAFKEMIDNWERQRSGKWLFLPLRKLFNIDTEQLRLARKNVFEYSAVRSFYVETCELLASHPEDGNNWKIGSSELAVLAQLIKLRAGRESLASPDPNDEYTADSFFNPFCNYWCDRTDGTLSPSVPQTLNDVLKDLYVSDSQKPNKKTFPWPPPFLSEDSALKAKADGSIADAVTRFINHWDPNTVIANDPNLTNLLSLVNALAAFDTAEQKLLKLASPADFSNTLFNQEWEPRYAQLVEAQKGIELLDVNALGTLLQGQWYQNLINGLWADANECYAYLLGSIPQITDPYLLDLRKSLLNAQAKWKGELVIMLKSKGLGQDGLIKELWTKKGAGRRPYEIRFDDMYKKTNPYLDQATVEQPNFLIHPPKNEPNAVDAITTFARQIEADRKVVADAFKQAPDPNQKAGDLCNRGLKLAEDKRIDLIVKTALGTAAKSKEELETMILKEADVKKFDPVNFGRVANKAKTYLQDWNQFRGYINDSTTRQKVNSVYEDYVREYWLDAYLGIWTDYNIPKELNWNRQHAKIGQRDYYSSKRSDLKSLGDTVDSVVAVLFPEGAQDQAINDFKESRNRLKRTGTDDSYTNVVVEWARLGDDAYAAKKTILDLQPENFLKAYFPARDPAVTPARFVDLYWWRFSLENLRVLSSPPPTFPPEANDLCNKYNCYPLLCTIPGAVCTDYELSRTEFNEASELWSQIAKEPSYDKSTIGGGANGRSIDTQFDDLLDKLRSTRPSPPKWFIDFGKRLSLVKKTLDDWSGVELIIPEGQLTKKYHYVGVGEARLNEGDTERAKLISGGGSLGTISWSESDLTFWFYIDYPEPNTDPDYKVPVFGKSDWMLMRILDKLSDPNEKWPAGLVFKLKWIEKPHRTP